MGVLGGGGRGWGSWTGTPNAPFPYPHLHPHPTPIPSFTFHPSVVHADRVPLAPADSPLADPSPGGYAAFQSLDLRLVQGEKFRNLGEAMDNQILSESRLISTHEPRTPEPS